MIHGIAGYKVIDNKGIERSYAGIVDKIAVDNLEDLMVWMTQYYPNSFHIVWKLSELVDVILRMIPENCREELKTKTRVKWNEDWGSVKIFSVDKMLGITIRRLVKGNIYQEAETNFYQIEHWMPSEVPEPKTAIEVEQCGNDIEEALEKLNIDHNKLTSPVGVYSDYLREYNLPTTYSNNNIIDASLYCEFMMRREWRCAYKVGYFDKVYSYDLMSAYPKIIADLPNTDKCVVKYSKEWLKGDWGIIKARVDITEDKTPIVYDTEDGEHMMALGSRLDMFTTEELFWIHNHNAGKIEFIDGYFFKWLSDDKPYKEAVSKLIEMRSGNEGLEASIARNISQGLSGKLDQDNLDNTLGEFYNPVSASICRSRCRLLVADFIWDNSLQDNALTVQVDGVNADRYVEATEGWRYEGESPALVLGKGEIWKIGKKPLGLTMDEVVGSMKEHPKRSLYKFDRNFIDLVAMSGGGDRMYSKYPANGREALSKVSGSKPIRLG